MTTVLDRKIIVTTTCVIPGKPHRSEDGLLICRNHLDELAEWLHDVQREADNLNTLPSMQIVWDHAGGNLASHRSPARLDAIVLRDERRAHDVTDHWGRDSTLSVFATLHAYATLVRHARGLTLGMRVAHERVGTVQGPFCAQGLTMDCDHTSCWRMTWRYWKGPQLDVATERTVLTRHLDWCAAQPWIDALRADIQLLRAQLLTANGTAEPGPIPGRCPEFVGDRECGGKLWPAKPVHTAGDYVHVGEDVVQAMQCDRDHRHRWESTRLRYLALMLIDQAREDAS